MRRPVIPLSLAGLATLVGLLAGLLVLAPVGAGVSWCRADPIVGLNGTEVQVLVAVPEQYVPLVNGPINVEVYTPRQVTQQLWMTDAGFNGYGEVVTFGTLKGNVSNGAFQTIIRVRVPMDETSLPAGTAVPLEVTVITGGNQLVVYGYQYAGAPDVLMSVDLTVKGRT